jgi:hypothetical protein
MDVHDSHQEFSRPGDQLRSDCSARKLNVPVTVRNQLFFVSLSLESVMRPGLRDSIGSQRLACLVYHAKLPFGNHGNVERARHQYHQTSKQRPKRQPLSLVDCIPHTLWLSRFLQTQQQPQSPNVLANSSLTILFIISSRVGSRVNSPRVSFRWWLPAKIPQAPNSGGGKGSCHT